MVSVWRELISKAATTVSTTFSLHGEQGSRMAVILASDDTILFLRHLGRFVEMLNLRESKALH